MKKCSLCEKHVVGWGYCKNHHRAFMKYGDPLHRANLRGVPFDLRYSIDEKTGCWVWIGSTCTSGYGIFTFGRERKAHRVSFLKNIGPIPLGVCVLHRCDSPNCVNPNHLFLGTHAENMADMKNKGRAYGAPGAMNAEAKITEAQALAIMGDSRSGTVIAADYGLSRETVSSIRNGKSWKHIFDEVVKADRQARGKRKFSEEEKIAIIADTRTQKEIAETYRTTQGCISVIMRKAGVYRMPQRKPNTKQQERIK